MDCPVCKWSEAAVVFTVPVAPATCTAVFDSQASAREVPSGGIDLAICRQCGHAYNRRFDLALARAGAAMDADFASSQAASTRFSAFSRWLAAQWVDRHALHGKACIEVGAGGGDFAADLIAAGAGRVVAIDPLTPPKLAGEDLVVLNAHFGHEHSDIDAQALICRHTLEHVHDVAEFLGAISEWAQGSDGRVVLFELPSADRIREEGAFWDVYYEHCNYFTSSTLPGVFARAGLALSGIELAFDQQYFIVQAQATRPPPPVSVDVAREVEAWRNFGQLAKTAVARTRVELARLSREGPLVFWQGAGKTIGVLSACQLDGIVHCAVDQSPERWRKFLPGSGLAVIAPDELVDWRPKNIVLMNAIYEPEVRAQLQDMRCPGHLWTINELVQPNMGGRL